MSQRLWFGRVDHSWFLSCYWPTRPRAKLVVIWITTHDVRTSVRKTKTRANGQAKHTTTLHEPWWLTKNSQDLFLLIIKSNSSTRPTHRHGQYRTCCLYVRAYLLKSHKTKQISSENCDRYWLNCGSFRVDHRWHTCLVFFNSVWIKWRCYFTQFLLSSLPNIIEVVSCLEKWKWLRYFEIKAPSLRKSQETSRSHCLLGWSQWQLLLDRQWFAIFQRSLETLARRNGWRKRLDIHAKIGKAKDMLRRYSYENTV